MTKPVDPPKSPKKLKKQPTVTSDLVVTQVQTVGGNAIDLCFHCRHITTKVITDQTTCSCCRNGHTGL